MIQNDTKLPTDIKLPKVNFVRTQYRESDPG